MYSSIELNRYDSEEENVRLDVQHTAITRLIGDEPFHAPVAEPLRILDIGCGSGIATRELAKRFPSAHVVGVDLAPPVELAEQQSNVEFVRGSFADLVKTGVLREGHFDYVFQRMLVMGIVDWQAHTEAAARLLKPGGWLEMQDLDWHVYDRNGKLVDERYAHIRAIHAASEAKGLDPFCGKHLDAYMRCAGLRSIKFTRYPFAWAYWKERPETELIATHQRSARQVEVRNSLLENLLGSSGMYKSEEIEAFKEENVVSYEQAEEGIHSGYGVAFGQKMEW